VDFAGDAVAFAGRGEILGFVPRDRAIAVGALDFLPELRFAFARVERLFGYESEDGGKCEGRGIVERRPPILISTKGMAQSATFRGEEIDSTSIA